VLFEKLAKIQVTKTDKNGEKLSLDPEDGHLSYEKWGIF